MLISTLIIFNRINILNRMTKRYSSDYKKFKKTLDSAENIVVLTGAGVSAESGIPVFRGAGGFWRTHRSTDLATPEAFKLNPSLVWEFYHYRRDIAFNAIPNKAHVALAQYERFCKDKGKQFSIITQNVDGLHQKAGSENVIELHGNLGKIICTKCKQIDENLNHPICSALNGRGKPDTETKNLPIIPVNELPKCKKCQQLVRPYIVWFGENLDHNILNKSKNLVEICDLCIVIGTSSIVYPAAMFAPTVSERGKPVAEFNINLEPADANFSYYFSGPCGTTLPKALGINV